jgi:hypothetical protein
MLTVSDSQKTSRTLFQGQFLRELPFFSSDLLYKHGRMKFLQGSSPDKEETVQMKYRTISMFNIPGP